MSGMQTEYVNLHALTNDETSRFQGPRKSELRIEDSENFDGKMALGIFDWDEGSEFATAHLNEKQVLALRRALDLWLIAKRQAARNAKAAIKAAAQ